MDGRLRAAAVLLSLAVPLVGCGSGSADSGTAELPPGPPTTAPAAASATTDPAGSPDSVLASYLRFWDAVIAAHRTADPGLPALRAAAVDPELARVRDTVSRNKVQKLSLRGEVGHAPGPATVSGSTATLEDCYDISGWDPVSLDTGKPIDVTDESGTGRYRARFTLRRSGAGWLVVDQKALGGC